MNLIGFMFVAVSAWCFNTALALPSPQIAIPLYLTTIILLYAGINCLGTDFQNDTS
jgi:hypothetical protein